MTYQGFFTKEELHERGWRYGTIHRLFSSPSKVIGSKIGERVELYRHDAVLECESSVHFEAAQIAAGQRSIKRAKEEIQEAREAAVNVSVLSRQQLRAAAVRLYNRRQHSDSNRIPVIVPAGFWEKLELDHLVKDANWDMGWDYYRKNPVRKAEEIRIERVLMIISRTYPHLASECMAQLLALHVGNVERQARIQTQFKSPPNT